MTAFTCGCIRPQVAEEADGAAAAGQGRVM
jgi:hypothetical protein